MRRARAGSLILTCLFLLPAAPLRAERVSVVRLLPESTVGFLRVTNAPELKRQFADTSIGRILKDEEVQPFVGHLYESVLEAYKRIEANVGASLEELTNLMQGELCLALVASDSGQPAIVLLVDVGDQIPIADALLQRLDDVLVGRGVARTTTEVGDFELLTYRGQGDQRELNLFVLDETVVFTTSGMLAEEILSVREGSGDDRTLADNRKFATIMNRSRGSREERPQITWFVDPIELFTKMARGNLSGQAGLATLKGLGGDGLKAAGGSVFLGTSDFELVGQSHVLLATPREGVIRMVAFGEGDLEPEPWVPVDVASYLSLHWDVDQTFDELVRLYEVFRGEGAWQTEIMGRVAQRLAVEPEEELLAAIDGRISIASWIEKPARINSQATLVGVRLTDADAFAKTLAKVIEQFPQRVEAATHGSATYYRVSIERGRRNNLDESIARRPQPCVGIVGDYLLLTDSEKLFQEAVATKNDATRSLASELDFKLIHNKIKRQLGARQPAMIAFQRPEEGFRLMYDLATSPDMQGRLGEFENPVARALSSALDDQPLPAFSVLAKYLAPSGAMLIQDETGLHYTSFSLRREQ
jgi:hypothetical protein